MYAWALTLRARYTSSLTLRTAAFSGKRAISSSKSSFCFCSRVTGTHNIHQGRPVKSRLVDILP